MNLDYKQIQKEYDQWEKKFYPIIESCGQIKTTIDTALLTVATEGASPNHNLQEKYHKLVRQIYAAIFELKSKLIEVQRLQHMKKSWRMRVYWFFTGKNAAIEQKELDNRLYYANTEIVNRRAMLHDFEKEEAVLSEKMGKPFDNATFQKHQTEYYTYYIANLIKEELCAKILGISHGTLRAHNNLIKESDNPNAPKPIPKMLIFENGIIGINAYEVAKAINPDAKSLELEVGLLNTLFDGALSVNPLFHQKVLFKHAQMQQAIANETSKQKLISEAEKAANTQIKDILDGK